MDWQARTAIEARSGMSSIVAFERVMSAIFVDDKQSMVVVEKKVERDGATGSIVVAQQRGFWQRARAFLNQKTFSNRSEEIFGQTAPSVH